jgi:hypothetical protein
VTPFTIFESLQPIPAGDRQPFHLPAVDIARHLGLHHVDQRRTRRHGDILHDGSKLEREGDGSVLAD